MNARIEKTVDLLMEAAAGVVPAPSRQPRGRMWCVEEYRHSTQAAISSTSGPVTFTAESLSLWEQAVTELWKDSGVQRRWAEEERWGLIASLVVQASERDVLERRDFLAQNLADFCTAGPAFSVQMVSNVSWPGAPTRVGNVVVGRVNGDLFARARKEAGNRALISDFVLDRWLADYVAPRIEALGVEPVACCCWTVGQEDKAFAEADRLLREVVDLPLLLERDLVKWRIFRRGSVNRPGVRGLSLDRGAVDVALKDHVLGLELAAFPVLRNGVMSASPVHWYSPEPLPLGHLYGQAYLRDAVERSLSDSPIGRRIRVAARWFAEAHYATELDDSALALGVCLDALLTGKGAFPGNAMGDRVALLHDDPSVRRGVRKQYMDFYGIRSAVAHGGLSSSLNQEALNGGFRLAHDIAWRLLAFDVVFAPSSDKAVDDIFDDLRLGIATWPMPDGGESRDGRRDRPKL